MNAGVSCISGYREPVAVPAAHVCERPPFMSRSVIAAAIVLLGMCAAGLVAATAEAPESAPVIVETSDLPREPAQPGLPHEPARP